MRYVWWLSLLLGLPWRCMASEPVNTAQFAAIQQGMPETEVIRRLGTPQKTYEEPSSAVTGQTAPSAEQQPKRRHTYFYPGKAQMMDVLITFEEGKVVDKVQVAQ